MSLRFTVQFEHSRRVGVLELSGDLDITVRHRLRVLVDQVLVEEVDGVVVDLSRVRFIDMTGVNALVSLVARIQPRGIRVVLAASPRLLDRLLRLLDLYDDFDHTPTLGSAMSLVATTQLGTVPLTCSARCADPGRAL
jgi:anti-anti-sigma factor